MQMVDYRIVCPGEMGWLVSHDDHAFVIRLCCLDLGAEVPEVLLRIICSGQIPVSELYKLGCSDC